MVGGEALYWWSVCLPQVNIGHRDTTHPRAHSRFATNSNANLNPDRTTTTLHYTIEHYRTLQSHSRSLVKGTHPYSPAHPPRLRHQPQPITTQPYPPLRNQSMSSTDTPTRVQSPPPTANSLSPNLSPSAVLNVRACVCVFVSLFPVTRWHFVWRT